MATTLTASNEKYEPKNWETVNCPFCDSDRSRVYERFGYQHRFTYQKCLDCHLIFQNPRPKYDEDFIETAYEVYSSNNNPHYNSQTHQFTDQGKIVYQEYHHILKEIEAFVGHKGSILDIGCNTGLFLKVAKDDGWQETGFEISRSMTEIAQNDFQVNATSGDWMEVHFEKKFDAIYCSHVIEHIPNPIEWLLKMKANLNEGGIICISVPNMQSIARKVKRVFKWAGLRKDKWEPWQTPDHLYEPCEESFRTLFKKLNLELVETYTYPSEWDGKTNLIHKLNHFWLR